MKWLCRACTLPSTKAHSEYTIGGFGPVHCDNCGQFKTRKEVRAFPASSFEELADPKRTKARE